MYQIIVLGLVLTVNAFPSSKFDGRIVGGRLAYIEDYPYQVSLHWYEYFICGGSIISPEYIITAAHCTKGYFEESLIIRAGSNSTDSNGQEIAVKKVYQNPSFDANTLDYDISILYLSQAIEFGPAAQPIGIVPKDYEDVSPGIDYTVTGWGTLAESASDLPTQLQVVNIPSITNEKCQEAYGDRETITERMLCAQAEGGGKDTCQGDSGGPLVLNGLLVGIVSWGYGCGKPEYPGVYTKVSELREFISNITNL